MSDELDPEEPDHAVEEYMTDAGNEATDRCRVCRRLNNPGAADHCSHFLGLMWDGEIIWSRDFEDFEAIWYEVSSLPEEFEAEAGAVWSMAHRIADEHGLDHRLVRLADADQWTPSLAVAELVEFKSGATYTTDGMLSGSGFPLYHEDPLIIRVWADRYRELLSLLRSMLHSCGES